MRRLCTLALLAVLLGSCGTKKRTSYSKRYKPTPKTTTVDTSEDSDDKLYPMPEDNGKFVKFPINSVEEYIDTFAEIAQFEMKAYGIPASITLAQGILESGFGRGQLTTRSNNHFGIKCHKGWDGQVVYHDDDEKGECFRKYNHPMYSFRDHSIFLSSRSRYASLFELRKDNYKAWARGLKAAGYATDKRYPQKLISFIEQYKLYEYDRAVMREKYGGSKIEITRSPEVYIVKAGDTLYSISRRYLVSVEELMELNRMEDSTLSIGQELKIKSE
ncbi:glucosaminidase domain-containing protein [Poritiphilus flavus]|uniref:Peptidoglycan hydrolase n=1 Tax=Poritiphilus flavus TaxID=2697053 RepID=A0A6L9EHV7_9FLAO|nr:glucosaminidase domain-containing protein [Poritiphilus flavus]NAS14377.1 LysM peptidoglycan-binding domain-containing protein [Poritiphilus flavus]